MRHINACSATKPFTCFIRRGGRDVQLGRTARAEITSRFSRYVVEERRVLCGRCTTWVYLQDIYCLHSWESHLSKCIPTQNTNSRQATKVDGKIKAERSKHRTEAERAEALRNDPRTSRVEPRRVLCGMCGVWIKLRNNTTYCATPWLVHAQKCRLSRRKGKASVPSDTVPSTSAVPGKAP
ncbi:hypothetical protein JB92DRAFT_2830645 [Gautieria morchelliformis]|nr:hypothetical protein JB92DRAFT_2830645 [Gautieria morchelliformis]